MALLLYIFGRTLTLTAVIHSGFLLFYFLVDYVESSSAPVVGGSLFGGYCVCRILMASVQIVPASLSVGACLSVGLFKRSGEWEAMQAAGLGLLRLYGAVSLVAVAGALLSACIVMAGAPGCFSAVASCAGRDDLQPDAPGARWLVAGDSMVRCSAGVPVELVQRDGNGNLLNLASGAEEVKRSKGDLGELCAFDAGEYTAAQGVSGMQLSQEALGAAILKRKSLGLPVRSFVVERALRLALLLACFIAPWLAFGAIERFKLIVLTGHAWAGLAATFTVALAILVPYQLALGGVISEWWIVAAQLGPVLAFSFCNLKISPFVSRGG